MSIIFGVHNYSRRPVERRELTCLACFTEVYASYEASLRVENDVGMGFQAYHTHRRSNLEVQPVFAAGGNMLVFDGRLDNYKQLINELDISDPETADSMVVLGAFQRWGDECFARFIGDWALALWSHSDRSLYLARDHAGTRTLYFEQTKERVLWSTYLETFFTSGATRRLNRNYAVRYLTGQPVREETPYRDIRAVPPAHYLKIRGDNIACHAHWQWMIQDRIHYRSVRTYEEHFLEVFGQSVARRTGPGAAILAELSGGIDSTSIVCMSDSLRLSDRNGSSREPLDTISLYDDLEPAWDEKPYFSIVERQRGRVGAHIDASRFVPTYEPLSLSRGLPLLPGADSGTLRFQGEMEEQLGRNYPVLLSGIGGDELLGGVPSGMPELADLLIAGNIRLLLERSAAWCLIDRLPLPMMLYGTAKFAIRLYQPSRVGTESIPDWVTPQVRRMCADASLQRSKQMRRIGMSPSTIDNGLTWWTLLESLPHLFPSYGTTRREHRYPYLDRELVEYLFRVPRHILVNPGRRRTLMRSALKDIVPSEILERRRKAYVVRRPLSSLQEQHEKLQNLFSNSRLADLGLITSTAIRSTLRSIADGQGVRLWPSLVKAISLELWLRSQPSPLSSA